MKHFILSYELSEDYLERRDAFRKAHLEHGWAAAGRGELLLAGPTEPADLGLLLFQGADAGVAERHAAADPYTLNGLVKSWRVREWRTFVGEGALSPVRPETLD